MNLGALLDLGVDRGRLENELKKLNIGPYEIKVQRDRRRGISGTRADVIIPAQPQHDPGHHCPHSSFGQIREVIAESSLSEKVKETGIKIFTKLAQAEAKVHGHGIDEVRFHEVGAVDSIVDIVGAAIGLELLNVDRVLASPVQVGGGFVTCTHGLLPVPAPATAEILKGIPMKSGIVPFEMTTPTGAAILAATSQGFTEEMNFIPEKIGYGIGQRDTDVPNVLRVFLGDMQTNVLNRDRDTDLEVAESFLLETNIDDMNPEMYDSVVNALFDQGAQDVYLTPIIMKKSRPAVKISILCDTSAMLGIEEVLWFQTTTFGLRCSRVVKRMLPRDLSKVKDAIRRGFGEARLLSWAQDQIKTGIRGLSEAGERTRREASGNIRQHCPGRAGLNFIRGID